MYEERAVDDVPEQYQAYALARKSHSSYQFGNVDCNSSRLSRRDKIKEKRRKEKQEKRNLSKEKKNSFLNYFRSSKSDADIGARTFYPTKANLDSEFYDPCLEESPMIQQRGVRLPYPETTHRSNGHRYADDADDEGGTPIPVQVERSSSTSGSHDQINDHRSYSAHAQHAETIPVRGETKPKLSKRAPIPKGMAKVANVILLSDEEKGFEVDKRCVGQELFDSVCDNLNLAERDFFGLRYKCPDDNNTTWLDLQKKVSKQVKDSPWLFEFCVKFYPPEPSQLREDLTRYLLVMQVRRDVVEERLPCSFVSYAILASYLIQSEIGDFDSLHHTRDGEYVKEFAVAPQGVDTPELRGRIAEMHRQHRGLTPAEADLYYLDQAKRLAFYGIDLHPAASHEKQDLLLGVNAYGLSIFREKLRLNRYPWPKILKISYRKNYFYIKLRSGEFEQVDDNVTYKCPTSRSAKRLWKVCVDFHTFFRLKQPEDGKSAPFRFPRFGSKNYQYSGSTAWGAKRRADTLDRMPPTFERTWSRRTGSRSIDGDRNGTLRSTGTSTEAKAHRSISIQDDGPEMISTGVGGGPDYRNTGVGGGPDISDEESKRRSNRMGGFSYTDPEALKNIHLNSSSNPNGINGTDGDYNWQGGYVEKTSRYKSTKSTTKSTITRTIEGESDDVDENGNPIIRERVSYTNQVIPPSNGNGQAMVSTTTRSYGNSYGQNSYESEPYMTDTVSTKLRTVETTTYTSDVDGIPVKHTTEKVTILSDGDPIDHDEALALAIQEATRMNPAMKVEKIEIEDGTD